MELRIQLREKPFGILHLIKSRHIKPGAGPAEHRADPCTDAEYPKVPGYPKPGIAQGFQDTKFFPVAVDIIFDIKDQHNHCGND